MLPSAGTAQANYFSRPASSYNTLTYVRPNAFRVHYHANGTGRDTYIHNDNGGFGLMYKPARCQSSTAFRTPRATCAPAPRVDSKTINYNTDGTGRDSYVVTNSGGFHSASRLRTPEQSFKEGLRKYDPTRQSYRTPSSSSRVQYQSQSNMIKSNKSQNKWNQLLSQQRSHRDQLQQSQNQLQTIQNDQTPSRKSNVVMLNNLFQLPDPNQATGASSYLANFQTSQTKLRTYQKNRDHLLSKPKKIRLKLKSQRENHMQNYNRTGNGYHSSVLIKGSQDQIMMDGITTGPQAH